MASAHRRTGFVLVGRVVPRALGTGYGSIQDALSDRLTLGTLAVLFVGKLSQTRHEVGGVCPGKRMALARRAGTSSDPATTAWRYDRRGMELNMCDWILGSWRTAGLVALTTTLAYVFTVVALRLGERRTLGEMSPYDFWWPSPSAPSWRGRPPHLRRPTCRG